MIKFVVLQKKQLKLLWKKFKKEVSSNKITYFTLGITLFFGLFLRVYRINDLLGFYYDQGRDALVIWDLIKKGEVFLIGPTTGLAGIFRGPYYYYLIAPAYFIGGGNPIWPSVFLSITTVVAIILGYHLGTKVQNRATGVLFAILASFSFYIVTASRWLSNPTPMFLLSMILVWAMFKIADSKKKTVGWVWAVIGLVSGLSLFNFGSSGELYYFVSLLIFSVWQWRKLPNIKWFLISLFSFFITFAPLILFNQIHDNILLNGFQKTFGQEQSFTMPTKFLFELRNEFYLKTFPKVIFHSLGRKETYILFTLIALFAISLPKFLKNAKAKVVMLLLISPLIGLYLYQGNYTVLYEYYMTGYFLIFLLLIAMILGRLWQTKVGQALVIVFVGIFLVNNYDPLQYILKNKSDGEESISFVNQKAAIDWIYKDANGRDFNVDVYVPPVIPYAYNYLFTWLGTTKYGYLPKEEQIELLYTLYEVDPPNPDRLEAWMARQKGIGRVEDTYRNGGITVERRTRLK
jgi:hypothetical protein